MWTNTLCEKDSDGDGLSNGLELGDPSCTWAKGATPQFDRGITHPGIATSEDVAREVKSCAADYSVPAGELVEKAVVSSTSRSPSGSSAAPGVAAAASAAAASSGAG